jgi:hypothetical protein
MGSLTALTQFPDQLTAGTTWLVRHSYPDYPYSQGWRVTFTFVNASTALPMETCTGVGDDHLLTVAASVTATFAAGTYRWQAVATSNDSTPLVEIAETGQLEILPLYSIAGASDQRTHAEKMLAFVQSLLEGKALSDVDETDIRTATTVRKLKTMAYDQLLKTRDRYAFLVAREKRITDQKRGVPNNGTIYMEFKG